MAVGFEIPFWAVPDSSTCSDYGVVNLCVLGQSWIDVAVYLRWCTVCFGESLNGIVTYLSFFVHNL